MALTRQVACQIIPIWGRATFGIKIPSLSLVVNRPFNRFLTGSGNNFPTRQFKLKGFRPSNE